MNRSQYTLNDQLADYFRKHAGEWLTIEQLAAVAGMGGWRTRVSNLKKAGFPLERRRRKVWIEARQKFVYVFDRRYVPPVEPTRSSAQPHDLNALTPNANDGRLW